MADDGEGRRRTKDWRRQEARARAYSLSGIERFHIIVTWPRRSHEGEEEKRLMLPRNFGRRLLGWDDARSVRETERRAQRRYLRPEPIFVSDSGQR